MATETGDLAQELGLELEDSAPAAPSAIANRVSARKSFEAELKLEDEEEPVPLTDGPTFDLTLEDTPAPAPKAFLSKTYEKLALTNPTNVIPLGEGALSTASGMLGFVGGAVSAGVTALGKMALAVPAKGADLVGLEKARDKLLEIGMTFDPEAVNQNVAHALTYEPRTAGGQQAAEMMNYPFELLAQGGLAAGEKVNKATGSPALATATELGITLGAPLLVGKVPGVARVGKALIKPKGLLADTKIVDSEGAPLQVYHGTAGAFKEFAEGKRETGLGSATFGDGHYFTDNPHVASGVATRANKLEEGLNANVRPVYLNIKNPVPLEKYYGEPPTVEAMKKFSSKNEYFASLGYDGLIIEHKAEGARNVPGSSWKEIVAFKPEQVVSVFDRERLKTNSILTAPMGEVPGLIKQTVRDLREGELLKAFQAKLKDLRIESIDPIGAGGPEAAALASRYASLGREATITENLTIQELTKQFTPEQLKEMFLATSEEHVKRIPLEKPQYQNTKSTDIFSDTQVMNEARNTPGVQVKLKKGNGNIKLTAVKGPNDAAILAFDATGKRIGTLNYVSGVEGPWAVTVLPEFKRRGVGTAMYDLAEKLGEKPRAFTEDTASIGRSDEGAAFRRARESNKPSIGFDRLPTAQRDAAIRLQAEHNAVADVGVEKGILKDRFEVYDPRFIVRMLDDQTIVQLAEGARSGTLNAMGTNFIKTLKQAQKRKHVTLAETEAALARKVEVLGGDLGMLQVLKDIRVLPIVTAKLKRAIATRDLVEGIRKEGLHLDKPTVSFTKEAPDWFTVAGSPMFVQKRPLIQAGKPVKDAEGNVVFTDQQIYMAPEYLGPITSIMSKGDIPTVLKALYEIKRIGVGNIMFNPITHNATILSKTFPNYGWKTFGWWYQGTKFMKDKAFVKEMLEDGGVSLVNQSRLHSEFGTLPGAELTPGRSFTAKGAGAVAKVVGGEEASLATRKAVDAAGDFWHGTLLWDRIAGIQAGLYKFAKDDAMKKGLNQKAASAVAGRLSNLYGGAIPAEELAASMNHTLNVGLFSKSFTGTNIALYKDALLGMPASTRGKVLAAMGEMAKAGEKIGDSIIRRSAMNAIARDVLYAEFMRTAAFAGTQLALKDPDEVIRDYGNRLDWTLEQVHGDPLSVLESPLETAQYLLAPTEVGKEGRAYIGDDAVTGRPLYAKLTFGKVAEDLISAWKHPAKLLGAKLSPTAKFGIEVIENKTYNGAKLRLADAGYGENLLTISKEFIKLNLPSDVLETMGDVMRDENLTDASKLRLFGALAGTFSISQGVGRERAVLMQSQRNYQDKLSQVMPKINKLLHTDPDKAMELMEEFGMTRHQITSHIKNRSRMSEATMRQRKQGQRTMTEEEQELLERPE